MDKTKRILLGISGKACSGKDSAGEYYIKNYLFKRLHFAGALKQGVSAIFGFSEADCYSEGTKSAVDSFWSKALGTPTTLGSILQKVGTDLFRDHFHKDIWVLALSRQIDLLPCGQPIVVCDVRFPNEADSIKGQGGKVYRINRSAAVVSGRDPNHPSEIGLDDYKDWDGQIDNNGSFTELHDQLDRILRNY